MPAFRSAWILFSRRITVGSRAVADGMKIAAPDSRAVVAPAVVLDGNGILLGVVEQADAERRAIDVMDTGAQTIRPDMTIELAESLMDGHEHLVVTEADGRYVGVYRS